MNKFKPAEKLLLSTPIGLNDLGALFDVDAPFSACRLCGAIYQTELDRTCAHFVKEGLARAINGYWVGDSEVINLIDLTTERRNRWRELHERRYHTTFEIAAFTKTGYALTPEAAHKLAPYGITPLGNMSDEIVHALYTAPRKPDNDAEG